MRAQYNINEDLRKAIAVRADSLGITQSRLVECYLERGLASGAAVTLTPSVRSVSSPSASAPVQPALAPPLPPLTRQELLDMGFPPEECPP
jgi:hypothetical protein